MQKNENRLCPLPYGEVLEDIINPFKPYHCHLHLLPAANYCDNSPLVLNEDDLKWVTNGKKVVLLLTSSIKINQSKTPNFRILR